MNCLAKRGIPMQANVMKRVGAMVIAVWIVLVCPAAALKADYREVLPNGVTVLISQALASPTVSVNIFVKVGSFEEDGDINGISHFYEHLFFRGTPRWPGYDFKRRLEALGGSTNAETTRDLTHFYVNLPKENAVSALEMMADAYINAELDPEAIDQERKAVLEEYNIGMDNPQRLVYDRLSALAYGSGHPYCVSVIGTESNIRRFQRADFQRFREVFYTPERTVVAIVGDVRPQDIMPAVRRQFGSFTRSSGRPLRRAAKISAPERVVDEVMHKNIKHSMVLLGFPGPSVHDKPDIYRLDVASFLLGVGRGSIINRDVVDNGKALSAGVDFLTQRFSGLILLYAVAPEDKIGEAREALLASADKLKRGEVSERDLRRAQNFLRGNFQLSNERNAGKAESLGFYASLGEESFPEDYCAQLDAVTVRDVQEAANKYFTDGYYAVTMKRAPEPEQKRRSRLDDYDAMGRRRAPGSRWF